MSDSIKVNSDVKLLTRYAMGLTPEEEEISIITPGTIPATIAIEKAARTAPSIFQDMKDPKGTWNNIKATEQSLKGANFRESYTNFQRNLEIQELERRFRPMTGNPAQELQKLQKAENIRNLAKEYKKLTGTAKMQKGRELQQALADFMKSQGMSKQEAKKFLTELTDKKLAKQINNAKKALNQFNQSKYYDNVRHLIGEAKTLKGKDYADKMKEIDKAIADANQKVHIEKTKGSLKPVSKSGKVWNGVKKATGYNKGKEVVNTALTKSSKLRTIAKFGRSNALTAVSLDLALAVPEIIATKQTFDQVDENGNPVKPGEGKGTEMALKQTGRVVATAGAQVAAYAIGAKVGTAAVAAAWAAKGAALGSVAPGVGTAIGAVVGLGVGLLTSWLAGKAMKKVVGKSELDQLQDRTTNKPAEQLALQAQQNDEVLEEVLRTARARYEQDPAENKDIKKAYKNVVTAYQQGDLGTASQSRELTKPEGTPSSDETTHAQTQYSAQQAASQTSGAAQNPQAAEKPSETKPADNPDKKSEDKNDDKTETGNSEKYQNTIAKLDYILNMLQSLKNPATGGMSGIFYNPMSFNNPFMMPFNSGMYA